MQNKTAMTLLGSIASSHSVRQPWRKGVLASAVAIATCGVSLDAQALALGAITVRSALGEPLRAEIEVPQISSEEAATLKANIGSPEAFRAAGVDFPAALACAECWITYEVLASAPENPIHPARQVFENACRESFWLAYHSA